MIFFYIRHGDPIYDPDSLTPLGERQAEAVAKRLALYGVDRIFASTSNRAIRTAQPTCELLKKDMTQLDFCNEAHAWREMTTNKGDGQQWLFQDCSMRRLFTTDEVRSLQERWYEHPELAEYQKGIERIYKETDAFFAEFGYEHIRYSGQYRIRKASDERIALFAHQGFGIAFLSCLLDIPYPQFALHFDMCHTGMTAIEFPEEDGVAIPRILTLSSDSHLYREGLPTNYNNILRF